MGVTPSKNIFDFLFIVTPEFKVPPSDSTQLIGPLYLMPQGWHSMS